MHLCSQTADLELTPETGQGDLPLADAGLGVRPLPCCLNRLALAAASPISAERRVTYTCAEMHSSMSKHTFMICIILAEFNSVS